MRFGDPHVTAGLVYWNDDFKKNSFVLKYDFFFPLVYILYCYYVFLIDTIQIFVNMLPLNQSCVLFHS